MKTRKMRIAVAFELEVTEAEWTYCLEQTDADATQPNQELLEAVAMYLAALLADDNEPGDVYWLRDPSVYWPAGYIEDAMKGDLETSPDQPEGTA